jgi:FAD:protein FMN transferase
MCRRARRHGETGGAGLLAALAAALLPLLASHARAAPAPVAPPRAAAHAAPARAAAVRPVAVAAAPGDDTTVYLDKAAALAAVFPGAPRVVELRHVLSAEETRAVEAALGRRLEEGGFFLYAAQADAASEPTGYAVIVAEIGKVRPITHIVSVTREGLVGRVAVMIYRESHGADVASERFMAQYAGKSLADPVRIDKDIINIAGSTLSGHAICRGVRKALSVVKVVLLDRTPAARLALLAPGTDVTPPRAAGHVGATPGAAPGAGAHATPDAALDTAPDGRRVADTRFSVPQAGLLRAVRAVMGSACSIDAPLPADAAAEEPLRASLAAALDEVARWDAVLSDWRPDTPLSRLNAAPAGTTLGVDAGLLAWLADSRRWWQATDGAFDPTVGALVGAWGLRTSEPARPEPAALAGALARCGFGAVQIDAAAGTATRAIDGLVLDPGGSGKGWALDRAAEVLAARGVDCALLSFGSTLLALAPPPGAEGWPVPVVHDGSGATVAYLALAHGALSVSGGGFSTFTDSGTEGGGVQRGHVLDPRTGVPVAAERLAWVRHVSASASDALSTALLVAGPALAPVAGASGAFLADGEAIPEAWPACVIGDALQPAAGAATSAPLPGTASARR